jgi:hypothetical protein
MSKSILNQINLQYGEVRITTHDNNNNNNNTSINGVVCFHKLSLEAFAIYNVCLSVLILHFDCIGCSFKFILKVGFDELIVNAPRIADHESAV